MSEQIIQHEFFQPLGEHEIRRGIDGVRGKKEKKKDMESIKIGEEGIQIRNDNNKKYDH